MTSQFDLFRGASAAPGTAPELLEGFRYQAGLISPAEEEALIARVRDLPFRDFEFHGHTGKRRVVSFGWQYDFSANRLRKADDLPDYFLPLREATAAFAGLEPGEFQHALVTEYSPGAGIGWHRDKAEFGEVAGVSLLSPCVLRFRRAAGRKKWERVRVAVEPRSAYLLRGPARSEWEHSILRVNSLRYSITFRNLREG
jgi:alkylated DNA repair dioxygenase AlkB